jgi:hypothetical protein
MNEGVLGCFGQDLNRMTIVSGTARSRRPRKGRSRCQGSKEDGATGWRSGLKESAEAERAKSDELEDSEQNMETTNLVHRDGTISSAVFQGYIFALAVALHEVCRMHVV